MNRALASYVRKVAYQEPPHTISRELVAEFRAVTPPEYQYMIEDMFETITLFENRAVSASYRETGGGKFEVTLKVSAKKMRSDEGGALKEIPMDDLVDIGVQGPDEKPLYLKKHASSRARRNSRSRLRRSPSVPGVDPVVKLIDRRPEDNTIAVAKELAHCREKPSSLVELGGRSSAARARAGEFVLRNGTCICRSLGLFPGPMPQSLGPGIDPVTARDHGKARA